MKTNSYALFKPGGLKIRGFAHGKLVEVRYIEVVPTDIESPDRDEFMQMVEQAQLSDEELRGAESVMSMTRESAPIMAGKSSST